MRYPIFLNNTSFALTEALTDEAYSGVPVICKVDFPSSGPDLPWISEGMFTLCTITHPSKPGQHEIVNLLGYEDMPDDTRVLMVERAREGTQGQAWPVGSVLECRVTGGMLEQLSAANSYMRRWEADIKQYEASSNISLQTAKINADVAIQTNNARLEATKIGLAAAAQRAASAWSMVSASASISGGVTQSAPAPAPAP